MIVEWQLHHRFNIFSNSSMLFTDTKSKAQKEREYWMQLEARLKEEEEELDRMEKEFGSYIGSALAS